MVTEFKVGAAHTINLGNFESLRVEAQLTVNVPADNPDWTGLIGPAQQQLTFLLEQTVAAQHKPRDPRASPGVERFLQRKQERS